MPAGRNHDLVESTILDDGSTSRRLPGTAVGLTAALNCKSVLLDRGMAA